MTTALQSGREVERAVEAVPEKRGRAVRWSNDVVVLTIYLLAALYVASRLWRHVDRYILQKTPTDQIFFEFVTEHAARIFTHGQNPFFTMQLNAPDGVNMMANTSMLGLTIPLAPITLLFGSRVSFAVLVTFSLAATAAAWYWLFSRHLIRSRFAAFVGGAFCGFAPGMVSQANGHPNIATQVLVPFILWATFQLRERRQAARNGTILGLLVVYQAFINEEVLFFTALAVGVFVLVWALHHRTEARRMMPAFLRGLGVAAVTAATLLAYPLYVQFAGAQAYRGLGASTDRYGADLKSFVAFSGESLAGNPASAARLSPHPAEENAFFGWPLVVLCVVLTIVFWRSIVARAAVITGAVFVILSLGPRIVYGGRLTDIPGPYALVRGLPLFDSVIMTRLSLFVIPVIATILAMWIDGVMTELRGSGDGTMRLRVVALGLVLAAVLPLAPTPLPTTSRTQAPVFFSGGEWRRYVSDDGSVVTVPVTSYFHAMEGMQWAVDQRLEFRIAGGYFLGPDTRTKDRRGIFGPAPRPTADLLAGIANKGSTPWITAADKEQVVNDLKYWRASVVVLAPRRNAAQLRKVTTELLGFEPQWNGGVWVWDVRLLVGPTR